ncbi:transcription antitermination factor NusB [Alloscardovia theropitheci]|uniref:Transcription antitermination protein NusB n=1 Tax=Alloscardovia theropitheci TaxID=2496842 RepID=A0A4R0QRD3_9BIFI|nr:transcription antitermination factor NusB [Alloscardovia theropitheci]
MARSTARKRAFNTLFEADIRGQEITDLLDARIVHPGAQTPLPVYAIEIVRGVASHRRTIDKALDESLNTWEVSRMPAVDRNLGRMAAWEIIYNDDVASGIAIDEAISLAKTYAGDETPDLLYGVLSTIEKKVQEIRQEEIEWQNQRAALAAANDAQHDAYESHEDNAEISQSTKNFNDIALSDFDNENTDNAISEQSSTVSVEESEKSRTEQNIDNTDNIDNSEPTYFTPADELSPELSPSPQGN